MNHSLTVKTLRILFVAGTLQLNLISGQTNSGSNFDCSDFKFMSSQVQADSLTTYYESALKVSGKERKLLEKKFFCAFPDSFGGMEDVFGFNSETGDEAPLYRYQGPKSSFGESEVILFFANLKSIPTQDYYNKYINICVNGTWQADNISQGFYFHERLQNDTENVCTVLQEREYNDIYTTFRFIFDGPHPDNESNKVIFNTLFPLVSNQNEKLGNILKKAYDDLLSEKRH